MVVSGSDDEIYGVKRIWENSDFSSDCSKPKYKRRKVSARRDFPKGFAQFVGEVENVESDYEPEELEGIESDDEFPVTKDDVLSEPVYELPKVLYARHDYPVVFYHVARKICARRDYPAAFYANSSHVVKVEREESESEPEELEAIDSDDDLDAKVDKTESKCELEEIGGSCNAKPIGFEPICSVEKMGSEMPKGMQDEESVNQIGGKRRGYLQHLLASLDHMAATLLQMKQQGAFKKRSAV